MSKELVPACVCTNGKEQALQRMAAGVALAKNLAGDLGDIGDCRRLVLLLQQPPHAHAVRLDLGTIPWLEPPTNELQRIRILAQFWTLKRSCPKGRLHLLHITAGRDPDS
jgi:hypothetical protein